MGIIGHCYCQYKNFKRNALRRISTSAKWSALARIGNSYIVKMTIFAPFVGSLLIFNQNILELFDYSNIFLSNINQEINYNGISSYALGKLYFIYFGLFLIGAASIVYSIYCPEIISRFPFSDEYNKSRIGLNSPILCISSFESIAEAYARDSDSLPWHSASSKDSLSYSDELVGLAYSLLMRVYNQTELFIDADDAEVVNCESENQIENEKSSYAEIKTEYEPNAFDGYIMPTGYIDVSAMARDISSSPRALWPIVIPLKESSFKFQSDVYHLQYMIDDLSMPYQRLFCSGAYALGFIALFIPSAETFVRVFVHFFGIM